MKDLDINLVLKNIRFLVKSNECKIGDLEKEINVSSGYIARLEGKENSTKPNGDTLYKIAQYFNVSLDALLNVDFSDFNEDIEYLVKLLDKFSLITMSGKIKWEYKDQEMIGNESPTENHMLEYQPDSYGNVVANYYSKFTGSYVEAPQMLSALVKNKIYYIVKYNDYQTGNDVYEFCLEDESLSDNDKILKIFLSKSSGNSLIYEKFKSLFDLGVKTSQFAYLDDSMKNKLNDILDF